MTEFKDPNQVSESPQALRAENAALRDALRQAQEFCVIKEKKSIEYIFHLSQFKSRLTHRIENYFSKFLEPSASVVGGSALALSEDRELYANWLGRFDILDDVTKEKIKAHIHNFLNAPRFTLVLDCRHHQSSDIISSSVSLSSQLYQNFDVLVCGDRILIDFLPSMVSEFKGLGIQFKFIDTTSVASTKELLNLVTQEISGDYVVLLEAGNQIHATALYEFASEIDFYPEAQALYSDEDALDASGNRTAPFFKPDWNLELFLGQNYVGSFCAACMDCLHRAGQSAGSGGLAH